MAQSPPIALRSPANWLFKSARPYRCDILSIIYVLAHVLSQPYYSPPSRLIGKM